MFTSIENLKNAFILSIKGDFLNNAFNTIVESDTNKDGAMDKDEFDALSDRQKKSVQTFLEKQDKWDDFIEARQIAYQKREKWKHEAKNEARTNRNDLKEKVDMSLFPNGLAETFSWRLAKGSKGPEVALLQKLLTDAGYDATYKGKYDGDFGNGTRNALINYQRERLGQRGDGVMDFNGATMRSLLEGKTEKNTSSVTEESGILNGKQKRRAQIDAYISMDKTPELQALGHEAARANAWDKEAIHAVYQEVMKVLTEKIDDTKVLNAFRVTSHNQKVQVLDYFSNALKGGATSARVIEWKESLSKYYIQDNRVINKATRVVSKAGLSFATESNQLTKELAKKITGTAAKNPGEGVYFSVRTQWNLNMLESQTRAAEMLNIGGEYLHSVSETQADMITLAGMMEADQLKVVDKAIKGNKGQLTNEKLVKLIENGEVELDVYMFIEQNCSNIAYKVNVIDHTKVQENRDDKDEAAGWVSTTPDVDGWDEVDEDGVAEGGSGSNTSTDNETVAPPGIG